MAYLLGTDEAGYGPNLGPLCIAATAWEIPDDCEISRLRQLLKSVIAGQPCGESRIAIADSKSLYSSGASLELLERGVLVALEILARSPRSWRTIWQHCDPDAIAQIDRQPWHDGFDEPLPVATRTELLQSLAPRLTACGSKCGVRIAELQASILFPAAFNSSLAGCGNKAEVLSLATLQLARRVLEKLPPARATVFCDKHGGRNRYAALLQHVFPDELIVVGPEGAELSVYHVKLAGQPIEFRFQPKGERHLPTALASMVAKYLRELAMRPLNAFWQQHLPDLKPTAGYFNDAHRFYGEIDATRQRLAIARELLWREK